jgi:hypothetical protein
MLPVIYSMSMSLDGFNARPTCDIGWTAPRGSFASTLSRPATSPRTGAAGACTRKSWCGRPPGRPCPARRSWSSPGSGGRSRRWCSPRTLNSVAGTARLATDDIATEVVYLRYQRMR